MGMCSEDLYKLQVKQKGLCCCPEEVSQHEVVQKCWEDSTNDIWQCNPALQWCCYKWQVEPKKCSAGVHEHLSIKTRTQFPAGKKVTFTSCPESWVCLKQGEPGNLLLFFFIKDIDRISILVLLGVRFALHCMGTEPVIGRNVWTIDDLLAAQEDL